MGKGKGKKDNGEAKGTNPMLLASGRTVASGETRKHSVGSRRRTKEPNLQLQQFKQLQQ